MFYLFALGSMLGYALQNVLLAHHARKIDGLSLAFYRNISFVVTLSPLLLGASGAEICGVLAHWRLLLLSGLSGGIYLGLFYTAFRYLPVGVVGAVSRAIMTVLLCIVGWLFFAERLSPPVPSLILLTLVGTLALGLQRNYHPHLRNHVTLGLAIAACSALFLAYTNYAPIVLSRTANPLVSGYFWELSIGLGAGILLVLRFLFFHRGPAHVNGRTFLHITLAAWPTLIGTGLYTLATRSGPVAIVTAIGSAQLVIVSLLGWRLYREHLRPAQWLAIIVVLAGVVGLKFA